MTHDPFNSLSSLAIEKFGQRKRESSYDRSGGNKDSFLIEVNEKRTLMNVSEPGTIQHIWMTTANENFTFEEAYLRKIVLRMFWDDESYPSVEAPLGDFFGMGHGLHRNFISAPLQMSPEDGKAFNCWFPMPYKKARIEIENQCDSKVILYFYIDYVEEEINEDKLRFHAFWNRENPTQGLPQGSLSNEEFLFGGENKTGKDNYVLLEAIGKGHYVGCNLNIHNLRKTEAWNWPGEGDDMIFIDGEVWPPTLHGTGTEDYVNMGWCPRQEYNAPYHGLILGGDENWGGKITYYRYHILDPILFNTSIKVTIEHGHNNHRSDDWSSTAYWYQSEPHQAFRNLPPVKDRLPNKD